MKSNNNLNGGSRVKAGFYFNKANWEIVTVSGKQGGLLPGDAKADYLRVPAVAMLAGAPVLGAAFVVFLPVIGFALLAKAAFSKAFRTAEAPKPAPAHHD
jgi:hypothetical protein